MKKWLITLVSVTAINISAAQSDIADFFTQLKTFSADFNQIVEQDGVIVQQSTGEVFLKKPMKFRWDYKTPENMQLLSDGNEFYHYDVELAQATVKPVSEVTDSTLVTLLNDEQQLDSVFSIQPLSVSSVKNQFSEQVSQWLKSTDTFYQLTPKRMSDATPTLVVIGLNKKKQLSVFYAEDAYGKNTFVFNNIKQNKNLSDREFIFKAPKGVDVLGN
ncbi:MAG: outer membrane lipoprotein chaperone LolA [Gammaproteobacteria bacterium]|nr:outer membrane lipoprotein chaperone LolA [Gammaproteobacteria bacterium]